MFMKNHQVKLTFIVLIVLILSFTGCQRQYPVNIPYVKFDFTINILDPIYVNLQGVGGTAIIDGGSRGIVIYRVSID